MEPHRTIRVVAAVIEREGRYLITQRRPAAVLPLLWEFPGGRVEEGETDAAALKREVRHRLGVDIDVGQLISFVSHPYERYVVDLYLYECHITSGVTFLVIPAFAAYVFIRSSIERGVRRVGMRFLASVLLATLTNNAGSMSVRAFK